MWNTESLWVEVAVMSSFLLTGHIFMGHFEERTPKLRKFVKAIALVAAMVLLSYWFGRPVAFTVLGLMMIPVFYIHAIVLPRKGINGWTGEPKSRYYEFRGWSKNIFDDTDKG
ncbi:MAG: hypothetical protein RI909_281 [Bacteroidota bacterium]|jgi:bacteriorhodopsin